MKAFITCSFLVLSCWMAGILSSTLTCFFGNSSCGEPKNNVNILWIKTGLVVQMMIVDFLRLVMFWTFWFEMVRPGSRSCNR